MELAFTTLDVFTTKQLEGNPLAVVRVPASQRAHLTQSMKQKIAQEFNLSETVFLHDDTSKSGSEARDIDIFTTEREIPFAGHPTIGTATFVRHHLGDGAEGKGVRSLITKAGPIGIEPSASVLRGIQAKIPHDVHLHAKTLGHVLSSSDGLHPNATIRKAELDAPVFSIVNGMTFMLVHLASLELLAEVKITQLDLDALSTALLDAGWRDSLVARYYYVDVENEDEKEDEVRCLRTRMVGHGMEDPATGSAATALSAYLTLAQEKKGRTRFRMTQGVEMGRKSVISVETTVGEGDGKLEDVWLGGTAVVVMRGTLNVDA
ncbi:Diaminopimelate epimerase-like protein [Xylariaceae sp. AK1471]|nr:Diaminopimelate epimerase-like protein [Xylariaceae sp. AK1471]